MGVGVLGAPDPAPEAVTNYYVTRPPPPVKDSPSQNPAMRPLKRWVVNRLPWQEPPRLQLLGSLSSAAPREPTPLLRLLGSHSPTAPEEPTPLGPENFGGGIG